MEYGGFLEMLRPVNSFLLGPTNLHLHENLIRHTREDLEIGSWEGA